MATEGTIITQRQETTELLDQNGKTLPTESPLANIFDKIEQGVKVDEAIAEVMGDGQPKKVLKKEVETPAEAPIEQKTEDIAQAAERSKREQADAAVSKAAEDDRLRTELEAIPEDDLKVLPQDKPKTAKRIQALLKKIDEANGLVATTKKQADDQAQARADLEKQLQSVKTLDPKTEEEINRVRDELSMYRRRYELDKDPVVKAKYDDRIFETEKPIAQILTNNGAGEALLKVIQEEGGWLKFSQSGRMVPMKDGTRQAAEIAELVIQSLSFADRRQIESLSQEQITTKREKERFFEEEQRKAGEYFKKMEEDNSKRTKEYQDQVEQAKGLVEKFEKEAIEKNDWLKEKPLPANATADQKAAIEDENTHTKQLQGLMKKAVSVKDLPSMLEVVMDSVRYHQERRNLAKSQQELLTAKKEIDRLAAEVVKYKNASRTVPKAGSISSGPSTGNQQAKKPESLEEALEQTLMKKSGILVNDDE